MQNLLVSSDALILHCLPFLIPDVRMWVQNAAGVQLAAGSLFAGLVGSLCTDPGDVSWGFLSSGPVSISPRFLMLFEAVLL